MDAHVPKNFFVCHHTDFSIIRHVDQDRFGLFSLPSHPLDLESLPSIRFQYGEPPPKGKMTNDKVQISNECQSSSLKDTVLFDICNWDLI